jgi:hypothetical protein
MTLYEELKIAGTPPTESEWEAIIRYADQRAEHFSHDQCCGRASIPAEGVLDQILRGCEKCGRVWTEDLASAPKLSTLLINEAFALMRQAVDRAALEEQRTRDEYFRGLRRES